MDRFKAAASAFAAFAWLLAVPAVAQQGTAELRGRVLDQQGGALPGVSVLITNEDTGVFREIISGADGSYFAGQLLPGTFRVTAELTGFRRFERRGLVIGVGRTITVDVTLNVGTLEETVTVTGASPLVDLTSAEVGGTVTGGELTDLPTGNRSYFAAVALMPGIQFAPSSSLGNDTMIANGQTAGGNSVNIDGGSNNDDSSGTGAGGQVRVPLESVSEFQVLTNQFDAEFGRARGAIINALTKQGTNRFRGVGYYYGTSDAMTAKDFLVAQNPALTKPASNKQEFGATLGGPIIRDKMHFIFQRRAAACQSEPVAHLCEPAGQELHALGKLEGAEHPRPHRSPDEREQHVGVPVAARGRAPVQSDRQPYGDARDPGRRDRQRSDLGHELHPIVRERQGEHGPGHGDERVVLAG